MYKQIHYRPFHASLLSLLRPSPLRLVVGPLHHNTRPYQRSYVTASNSSGDPPKQQQKTSAKSPHAQWYADIVPAMIPVALLGSAVYLFLQLAQINLSHEKYLDEARARVLELEAEVHALRREQQKKQQIPPSGADANDNKPSSASSGASKGAARWWPFS